MWHNCGARIRADHRPALDVEDGQAWQRAHLCCFRQRTLPLASHVPPAETKYLRSQPVLSPCAFISMERFVGESTFQLLLQWKRTWIFGHTLKLGRTATLTMAAPARVVWPKGAQRHVRDWRAVL